MNIITEGDSNFVGMLMLCVYLAKFVYKKNVGGFQWIEEKKKKRSEKGYFISNIDLYKSMRIVMKCVPKW